MANLVFKPATGGGNKVIFQNQGGSDAITVEDSGNTTLAGTANNLGTVASGTLGSSIVFPPGMPIQTQSYTTGTTHGIGTNASAEIMSVNQLITARQTNSKYKVQIDCSIVAFASNDNPDQQDLGLRVRWGTSSGSVNDNEFGATHAHRLSGPSNMNTLVSFMSCDGMTWEGSDGGWSGGIFSGSYIMGLTVAAGQALYWKVELYAGSNSIYWNRHEASSTSNLGHTTIEITEIAT